MQDERMVKTMAQFASTPWQLWKARSSADAAARAEHQRTLELAAANEALQVQLREHKRMEEKLQQLNKDLETRVEESTAHLVTANADLLRKIEDGRRLQEQLWHAQKLESIGTLAGGIAHDFNNILNIIQGYASVLIDELTDAVKAAEHVQIIRKTVERGISLVQHLLMIARRTDARPELVNINELLEGLAKLLRETFPKTITVTLELDPKLPSIMADANQINQALLNLCINARDAMAGAGRLVLSTAQVSGGDLRGRFPEALEPSYVSILVTDTGIGISKSMQERIFQPFFTTKARGQGTGLGLSVVYGIVKNHGGFIDVESEPGRGAVFRLYLPVRYEVGKSEAVELQVGTHEVREIGSTTGTILFADDEEDQRKLMRRVLEMNGYRVLVAQDGAEAVDIYHRHKDKIAAVVLDIDLPKVSGWQVYLTLKRDYPKVKAVFSTGYLDAGVHSELLIEGARYILKKPYLPDDILRMIRDAISQD